MQKQIINEEIPAIQATNSNWLDLESLAHIELTSEDVDHPIESAFSADESNGWKAGVAGKQIIRIIFDHPQHIRKIQLLFCEKDQPRTQEFRLQYLAEEKEGYQPVLKQQFTFSPPQTTQELEEYAVHLEGVRKLELNIIPDITNRNVYATLAQLRLY